MKLRLPTAIATLSMASAIGLLATTGCQQRSAASHQVDTRPQPEQSFDEIARILKNALETGAGGVQSGYVADQGSARSQLSVHNDVTSELIPPSDTHPDYRGTITVTSRTTYSLRRIPDVDGKKSSEQESKKKNGSQDPTQNPTNDPNAPVNPADATDQDIISAQLKNHPMPGHQADDAVSRREEKDIRTYDLAYENNHWVLKTELDPKTEQSVSNAFKYAFSLQRQSP
jgi:hypothetical protein